MIAFDFALGGGVSWCPVFLGDTQLVEELFKTVGLTVGSICSSGESGGVDHPVIGQGGLGVSVLVAGGGEGINNNAPGDSGVSRDVEQVAGVVIEPGDDFYISVAGGVPVSEV